MCRPLFVRPPCPPYPTASSPLLTTATSAPTPTRLATAPACAPACSTTAAVMAPPPWFVLGPQSTSREATARELLSRLSSGQAFASEITAQWRRITGQAITRGGLTALLSSLWPSAQWEVRNIRREGPGLALDIFATDRAGQPVVTASLGLWRDASGALDLHTRQLNVAPVCAEHGLVAMFERLQQNILRALSDHPDTRLTLTVNAAAHDPASQRDAFVKAAQRGYLFADTFVNMRSPYYPCPDEPNHRELFKQRALEWVQNGQPCANDQAWHSAVEACRQPGDFLQLPSPQVLRPAFYRSVTRTFGQCGVVPMWCGVRFIGRMQVNHDDMLDRDTSDNQRQSDTQLRAESQVVAGLRLAAELQECRANLARWRQQVWADLHDTRDATRRRGAYDIIGLHGTAAMSSMLAGRLSLRVPLWQWLPCLTVTNADAETDPQARHALKLALRRLSSARHPVQPRR